jgi:hypothetical protein
MGKKPVVTLRVYRGKQMSYDAQGNVQNENQLIKLPHDTVEWTNFMKNITSNGYLKVDVVNYQFFEKGEWKDSNKAMVEKELEINMTKQTEVALTDDQKRIAELEAKLEKLLARDEKKSSKKVEVEEKPKEDKKERENLRIEYAELNGGKKAFPAWGADKLREKILELKGEME